MFEIGSQIAYVPPHANGDINHPDVQFGFITGIAGTTAMCRYWRKDIGFLSAETSEEAFEMLRTKDNGERTPISNLVDMAESIDPESILMAQDVIDNLIEWINERKSKCPQI